MIVKRLAHLVVLCFVLAFLPLQARAVNLCNNAWMNTATTGTGTITLSTTLAGYQSFDDCGITNGQVVRYRIFDGSAWEVGSGTYTTSGTTLTRSVAESSNADAALNLSGGASVIITPLTADLPSESTPTDGTVDEAAYLMTLEGGVLKRYLISDLEAALELADLNGAFVGTVADGTGIDGTASGDNSTYTPSLDLTEVNSATWGDGSFTTFTFNAGAVDPVFTLGSGTFQISAVTDFTLDDEQELRFNEEDANGSNYIGFKPPAALTSSVTCTFENDANPIPDSCVGDGSDGTLVIDVQTFTSSGTWTKPATGTWGYVRCWGGGGSGSKGVAADAGGGGGGGGYSEKWIALSSLGGTETVTIGAGGAAVTAAGTNGNAGGNTTFGSHLTAYGGGGAGLGAGSGGGGGGLAAGANGGGSIGGKGGDFGSTTGWTIATGQSAVLTGWGGYGGPTAYAPGPGNSPTSGGGGGASDSDATGTNWAGGNAINGGGGGGAAAEDSAPGPGAGGTSINGGGGGAGAFDASNATAGTQPGGGGGGSETGDSGAGGAGQCIVTVF